MAAILRALVVSALLSPGVSWLLKPSIIHRWRASSHEAEQNTGALEHADVSMEYDLVIIGAGASGLFASGASTMLGSRTLLIDQDIPSNGTRISNIGGDCSVSSCVPSKAVRSIARMATNDQIKSNDQRIKGFDYLSAKDHSYSTVCTVRTRENPARMVEGNANLDVMLVSGCNFIGPHSMHANVTKHFSAKCQDDKIGKLELKSKAFLIATGSSPVVPANLEASAADAELPLYTYRSIYGPLTDDGPSETIWDLLALSNSTNPKHVVIAGGGATSLEISQALARLGKGSNVQITVIAPMILNGEDAVLQQAAAEVLLHDGVQITLNKRVTGVLPNRQVVLSDGAVTEKADALVVCIGRRPSLGSLQLERANVRYDPDFGVIVDPMTLRSCSAKHVFACGDCALGVTRNPRTRTASHAAWTGYHAASNTRIPRFLRIGHSATHKTVPRVIYTDPQLASVGFSRSECIERYGTDGFSSLYVSESGTDRADMECLERLTNGFVELRSEKISGRIVGYTGCGPAAAEIANEMSLAITNKLKARDIAQSLHSYPSHGYLMYRVALALTFSDIWGLVDACGPLGSFLSSFGRFGSKIMFHTPRKLWKRNRKLADWELMCSTHRAVWCKPEHATREIKLHEMDGFKIMSFYDSFTALGSNSTQQDQLLLSGLVIHEEYKEKYDNLLGQNQRKKEQPGD